MKKDKGFTLIEMLVVVAIIALLISILLPSLSKARELSRQIACGANLKGIGNTCYTYQSDNLDVFPTSPYATPGNQTDPEIQYIENMGGGVGGDQDPHREQMSLSTGEEPGSTKVSTSRSFWLMVRTGGIIPKNFICPSSQDVIDPTVDVATYFDFIGWGAISYGYQIPYDDTNVAKPSADNDPRMVLVADKGPWGSPANPDQPANGGPNGSDPNFFVDTIDNTIADPLYQLLTNQSNPDTELTEDSTPDQWKRFNSPNHGGFGQGRGQNMLYPDAHASFLTKPLGGVDTDNIYTKMSFTLGIGDEFRRALQWGIRPEVSSNPIYPGDGSLEALIDSTTDTLLWP